MPAERQKNAVNVSGSLKKLIDTVQLKSHLAGMDAKDGWEHLSKRLGKIEQDIKSFGEDLHAESQEARIQAHLGAMEAKEKWKTLKTHLSDLVDDIQDSTQSAHTKFDGAILQSHLAKMEAEDAVRERQEQLRKEWNESEEKVAQSVGHFLRDFGAELTDFFNKLPR